MQSWLSGRIRPCQGCDPSPILGDCISFSKVKFVFKIGEFVTRSGRGEGDSRGDLIYFSRGVFYNKKGLKIEKIAFVYGQSRFT